MVFCFGMAVGRYGHLNLQTKNSFILKCHFKIWYFEYNLLFKRSLNAIFRSLRFEVKNWKFARGGGDGDIVLNAASLQKERLKWNQMKACAQNEEGV